MINEVNFRMFRRMDDDGSKNLNFEEFYKGIVETGLKCSEEECQKIMDKFDKDGNGTVNIDEFLIAIRVSFWLEFLCFKDFGHLF